MTGADETDETPEPTPDGGVEAASEGSNPRFDGGIGGDDDDDGSENPFADRDEELNRLAGNLRCVGVDHVEDAPETVDEAIRDLFAEAAGRDQLVRAQAVEVAADCSDYTKDTLRAHLTQAAEPPADADEPGQWWGYATTLFESKEATVTEATNAVVEAVEREQEHATIRETGELLCYDPEAGFYREKGEGDIRELLQARVPSYMNSQRRNNVVEAVRARNRVPEREFQPPAGKLCVANATLDLESRELGEHSPAHNFRSGLDAPYDPDAECPEWLAYLREVVPDEDARDTLQEFAGYCLEVWHHRRAKNLFCVGPTASGKSTFIETVQAMFGDPPATASLTPQQLAGRFDTAALAGAAINAKNDINSTKIEDSGTLKTIFAGEHTKVEDKYQDAMFAKLPAKHLFSANWLPRVVGEDEALFRRVLIVEFPESIPKAEWDRDLGERLVAEELPGILNWALEGRDRLHEQDGFTRDRSRFETRLKWLSWRSAPLRFLFTNCTITGGDEDTVERDAAYQAYKEWAHRRFDIRPQQRMTNLWKTVPFVSTATNDGRDVFEGVRLDGEEFARGYDPSV